MLLDIADAAGLPHETDLKPIIQTTKNETIMFRYCDRSISNKSGIYIPQGDPYIFYSTEFYADCYRNNTRENEKRCEDIREIKKILKPTLTTNGSIYFQIVRDRKIYIMVGLNDEGWKWERNYLATRKCRIDKKSGENA